MPEGGSSSSNARGSAVESVRELQAREKELAREWQWLVDVLNKVARARADNEEAETFRLLQSNVLRSASAAWNSIYASPP
jgi:hypothetical protein